MTDGPRYAPEYSWREIRRTLPWQLAAAFGVVMVCEKWLIPELSAFVAVAHCRTILGFTGEKVFFYGLFIGLPLLLAATTGLALLPDTWRILRTRQYPPPGRKVWRRTCIRTGKQALAIGVLQILCLMAPVALAIWGGLSGAPQTLEHIYSRLSTEAANALCAADLGSAQ